MQRTVTRSHLHSAKQQSSADLDYWLAQPIQARIDAL